VKPPGQLLGIFGGKLAVARTFRQLNDGFRTENTVQVFVQQNFWETLEYSVLQLHKASFFFS
jgi:hypothetical protein